MFPDSGVSSARFSKPLLSALDSGKILGIRAGMEPHRFLGIWVVVVDGRVFVRTWNDKPRGWYRAFLAEPRGVMQIATGRERRVVARRVRGGRLLDAIDEAYAEKYNTRASLKYVRGFKQARRRAKTLELVPRRQT